MGYILQRRSAWYEPRGEAMASPRGSYFSAAALGTRTSARGILRSDAQVPLPTSLQVSCLLFLIIFHNNELSMSMADHLMPNDAAFSIQNPHAATC